MAGGPSLCLWGLIASLTAMATVLAVPCQQPISQQECAAIRIKCLSFTNKQCNDSRGTFLRKGGICGFCDLCARFVGEGQSCNSLAGSPREGFVQVQNVCRRPLVCSARNSGVCVQPRRCEYTN